MPTHLCLAHYGLGLNGYQTGARIVRRAREQTGSEYIRPNPIPTKQGSDARRSEVLAMSAGIRPIWGLPGDPQGLGRGNRRRKSTSS